MSGGPSLPPKPYSNYGTYSNYSEGSSSPNTRQKAQLPYGSGHPSSERHQPQGQHNSQQYHDAYRHPTPQSLAYDQSSSQAYNTGHSQSDPYGYPYQSQSRSNHPGAPLQSYQHSTNPRGYPHPNYPQYQPTMQSAYSSHPAQQLEKQQQQQPHHHTLSDPAGPAWDSPGLSATSYSSGSSHATGTSYATDGPGRWSEDTVGSAISSDRSIAPGGPRRQPSQTVINGPRRPPPPATIDEAEAPPLPPQNSIWHTNTDAAVASQLRRMPSQKLDTALQIPESTFDKLETDFTSYEQNNASRPVSSATGIISLYGATPSRRGSGTSSSEDEERHDLSDLPVTVEPPSFQDSRRSSRPLPQPPDARNAQSSDSALLVPSADTTLSRSTSPYQPADLSRRPSPAPYTVPVTPPSAAARADQGYFDPAASGSVGQSAAMSSLSPDLSASKIISGPGPVWSPMAPSFPSTDELPSNRSLGLSSRHKPSDSVESAGEPSTTSHWRSASGDLLTRTESRSNGGSPNWQRANRQTPHLRVDSAPESLPKKRAPLPPVPTPDHSHDADYQVQRDQGEETAGSTTPVQTFPPPGFLSTNPHQESSTYQASHSSARPQFNRQDSWQSEKSEARSPKLHAAQSRRARSPSHLTTSSQYPNEKQNHQRGLNAIDSGRSAENKFSRTATVNFALLSHLALLMKDSVPRAEQVKGSLKYPASFTGRDIVSTIESLIPTGLASSAVGLASADLADSETSAKVRNVALVLAKSLKAQMFFHEVDWGDLDLVDGVEQVYTFLHDSLERQAAEEQAATPHLQGPKAGPSGASPRGRPESLHKVLAFEETRLDLSFAFGPDGQDRRDHPVSSNDLEELPTGVFVPLTTCYSPLCGRADSDDVSACYSPSCPRAKSSSLRRGLTLQGAANSGTDAQAAAAGGFARKAWAELVPKEILDSLPKKEITRQNAILEHIQKEEDFLADLKLLETLFIRGLERPDADGNPPPIPAGPERDDFIREVFGNHRELVRHVSTFVERLQIRQREESPVIQSIGDVFLDSALAWNDAFITYVSNYPLAKSRIQREQSTNPRFRAFVETCRRDPACRRLGLDNFIHRALPHLQRHPLLLQTIIDKTEETNGDRDVCIRAKEVIVEQCKISDRDIQAAQTKAKIRGFAYSLHTKRNKAVVDMDLLNPERQLIHEGRVYRKPDFTDLEWTEMQAILFDNYFAVTKLKTRSDNDTSSDAVFVLAKRPIPVEMLEVTGFNEASVSFSIGLNALHFRNERESRDLWPFTVYHLGGKIEPLTLYATSKQKRNEWRIKIDEAKGLRRAVVETNRAFESTTLCDATFALPIAAVGGPGSELASGNTPGADNNVFHGRITCAVPFTMADNRRLIALGCADGVWIGLRSDPSSFRKVLHLKFVTQCAVLEQFGTFVVLADRVLIAYSLENLVPASTGGAFAARPPQKLSGNRGVLFFGVGTLRDRTLLVYMKKKANESVFKVLEPVLNQQSTADSKSGGGFFKKLKDDIGKNSDWFRMFKVFFIPSEAHSMQFLRSKLAILCARGFEIMNLDTLHPGTIPDFSRASQEDPRIFNLARRVENAKPLGMFKLVVEGDFLLCFDGFACYVDRSGEPIKLDNIVEWEGTPHTVSYSPPYILAFDHRFIEVREASSGRLVQILRGSEFRCISANSVVEGVGSHADGLSGIIGVQRQRTQGRGYDTQHIFELVQTAPPASSSVHPSTSTLSNLSRTNTSATTATFLTNSSGFLSDSASTYLGNASRGRPSYSATRGQSNGGGQTRLTRKPSTMTLTDPPAPAGWI
ncbi:unnamed protein product [Sympodiomycopsis kandeliae]